MMKSIIYIIFFTAVLSGCQTLIKPPLKNADGQTNYNRCIQGAPAWVLTPHIEGALSATGSSAITKSGLGFAKTKALSNARDELARSLETKVKNLFKSYTRETGVEDQMTIDSVSEGVSRQVAAQSLRGSVQKGGWIDPCNNLHVLVMLDENRVAQYTKSAIKSSLESKHALRQVYLADQAQQELDKLISKEFGTK